MIKASITIHPSVTQGQVTTVAETVLNEIFSKYETALESENPINDKKQFYRMRAATVKMLIAPIQLARDSKESLTLRFEYDPETGNIKMAATKKI